MEGLHGDQRLPSLRPLEEGAEPMCLHGHEPNAPLASLLALGLLAVGLLAVGLLAVDLRLVLAQLVEAALSSAAHSGVLNMAAVCLTLLST